MPDSTCHPLRGKTNSVQCTNSDAARADAPAAHNHPATRLAENVTERSSQWSFAAATGILYDVHRLLPAVFATLALLLLPTAASAKPTLPPGTTIAGVDVSNLGPRAARTALEGALEPTWSGPITVKGRGGAEVQVKPADAGQFIRYSAMIDRAYVELGKGTTPISIPLMRTIRASKLDATVASLVKRWYKAPRNATYSYGITHVSIHGAKYGSGPSNRKLRSALYKELRRPHTVRRVVARIERIRPAVTIKDLKRRAGTFVSVDRGTKLVRLFKGLKRIKTYHVAVGAAGYDTPAGMHRVLSKERNPTWHVPNRPWAGALAGQTIPPGDPRNPLKAMFVAIGNGVGFHGTADLASIGQAASHGCIRMRVPDVLDLASRVSIGTPVLIR
jgi:lipoprotein-anchoring transpeptidase ErfK/SrfK